MIENVSRRALLKNIGFGASALVLYSPLNSLAKTSSSEVNALGVFVSVAPNGDVQIVNHRAEMGQGIFTSVPQIIADELEADWQKISVVQATGDSKFGDQSTGGSASIRRHFAHIRQMGAIARTMLEQAAAKHWQVPVNEVAAKNHFVIHAASKRKLSFGELAEAASQLPLPDAASVKLKKTSDFKLVGKDVGLKGQETIVRGEAVYAQDFTLPGMLIASIQRPPVIGGKVKSFDAVEAKKVAGVVDVIQLRDRTLPTDVKPLSGVAVLATNTWAAQEARKKLNIEWDYSDPKAAQNAKHNSSDYLKELVATVKQKGIEVRKQGDVYAHEYATDKTLEAVYTGPYQHHMSMEPPAATAWVQKDRCQVWTGTQAPQWARGLVAEEAGIPQEQVEINMLLMGGAFGRKGKNDFTLEAVELSKATGKPVKVIWTREDDVKHGFYHSISANYLKAELTDDGKAEHWLTRVAYPPIASTFNAAAKTPGDFQLSLGFGDIPFDVKNMQAEVGEVESHVRIGWFRAVAMINNGFALGSFVDELAAKAEVPTDEMWLRLIGPDRIFSPAKNGFPKWVNYGQESDDYALDTKRMKDVIRLVVEKSNAREKTAKDEGWGVSYAHSFNSYVAAATKVRVKDGKVTLLEMHTAIDCGIAITPDRVKSQMEGAMIMGATSAMLGGITVKDGAVEQNNFYDYPMARMPQIPPLFVHIQSSNAAPGGVGEPGMGPVLASVTNAIYHASGKRIRDLPVSEHLAV